MRKLITSIVLALAATACGEVKTYNDAGAGPDGNDIDAETPAPDAIPTGPVTVTATHYCCTTTGPAAGVDVIVVGPDGTVGETVQTGADGTATVQVTAGDSVTTILHEGTQHFLTTHVAVEPGDQLVVGGNYLAADPTSRGTMTATWTAFGGATSYYVFGPCSYSYVAAPATSVAYNFNTDCGTSTFDVAVVAYGASGIIGWKVLANQSFVNGQPLPLGTLQNNGTFGVSVSGLPAEVTSYYLSASGRLNGGGQLFGDSYGGAPAAGAVTGSFPWSTAGAGIVAQASYSRDGGFQQQQSREILPSSASAYNRTTHDLLPWVSYTFTISFAARTVTWIQSGAGAYDGAAVTIYYYRSSVLFGGTGNSYRWTLVVPPGTTNLVFPEMPPAFAVHDLQDTDSGYGGVFLFDRGDADGYRGFRGVPVRELECPNCGNVTLDTPPMKWSGQVSD